MFLNGVATATAGSTAEVQATWMLPLSLTALAGASVVWEVLDSTGSAWATGDADELRLQTAPVGTDTHVIASATIGLPLTVPADPSGTSYQVRWTLKYGTSTQWAFDAFTLYPRVADAQGPANQVVLSGEDVEMMLTLPTEFPNVKGMLYYLNVPLVEIAATHNPAPEGHRYFVRFSTVFESQQAPGPSLTPYTLIWKYGPSGQQVMEQASLWLINPTILQAQAEVRQFLMKAYSESGIDPDGEFQPPMLLQHLLQGCEMFNALGYPTTFTMTRATGAIRALWLRCATISACRSQYLHEGMKAFNFGGQVVTLDVDRSQYWDSLASNLQQELDSAIKPFKENLVRRGLLGGPGDINATSLSFGAIGSVGIAITPVSPIRAFTRGGLTPFRRTP